MSHVDDGTLHALLDDELDAIERASVEAHLASCGDCARRFAEATVMARQVTTLLGALDEVPSAVRIAPSAPRATVAADDTARHSVLAPMRRRAAVIRRIAIAASVMLVAGVSYEVGRRREPPMAGAPDSIAVAAKPEAMAAADNATSIPTATPASGTVPSVAAAPTVASATERAARGASQRTSVAGAGADAAMAAPVAPSAAPQPLVQSAPMPAPSAAAASRNVDASIAQRAVSAQGAAGARMPALGTYDSVTPPSERAMRMRRMESQLSAVVVTGMQSTARRGAENTAADVALGAGDARRLSIPGYRTLEDEVLPAITRRRYVAADGTTLVLMIAPATKDVPKMTAKTSPEFTVSTVNGRSTVRWQVPGLTYELQGTIAPDSLVKLATQLK